MYSNFSLSIVGSRDTSLLMLLPLLESGPSSSNIAEDLPRIFDMNFENPVAMAAAACEKCIELEGLALDIAFSEYTLRSEECGTAP